jgi:signal transduction histidine kinase
MTDKILCVDDDVNLLAGIQRNLRKQFRLDTAPGGAEGLELLTRQGPYAVVVADMLMPNMNGVEFLRACREKFPDTVRIMLTGDADQETAVQAVNQGQVFQFLNKPCPPDALARALENGLRQYRLIMTQREMMQLQLQHAQKMVIVGQMAASIAHDFNNILCVIGGLADLALMRNEGNERLSQTLNDLREAVASGSDLTRQLVGFCRKQDDTRFAELDLAEFLPRTAKLLRAMLDKIELECECAPDLRPVHADAGLLGQLILNLAVNARDAMPNGGSIRIAASPVEVDAARAAAHPAARVGRFICVSVSDTGCGMNEATRKRIFEPFFTTKEAGKGTGLGLSIVQNAVQKHQGWVEVTSVLGKGTTFDVLLPEQNGAFIPGTPAPL